MSDPFPPIRFKGQLRPSQADAVGIARKQLEAGKRRLHIVAPPGSGKTVLGLYLWAECVRTPALVLSPNSAIQAQWLKRLDLFTLDGHEQRVSDDPLRAGVFNSLTYQSVTLPQRGDEDLDASAIEAWADRLIAERHAEDPDEAAAWIDDLRANNRDYYEQRLGAYRKQVRDAMATGGEALRTLHASARATIDRLAAQKVGLIIFDECHHLLGHWGRVLADAAALLQGPIVLGLTATPPDRRGHDTRDVERYDSFFGPVDYEVPVPALVRERHLAPYQDLAYFVRPGEAEARFIAQADERFVELVQELCGDPSINGATPARIAPLPEWIAATLASRRLPTGVSDDWITFARRDTTFADMGRIFLLSRDRPLPEGVPDPPRELIDHPPPQMAVLVPVLDRYIRHGLRRSAREEDRALAEKAIARLRMLGVQITETGAQACASPVSRVMAYASNKAAAIVDVLAAERAVLGDGIRAVVVTDYEKTSATSAEVSHLLDAEAGGAVAAFRALLTHEATDALQPILVTGSTVLVDDDLLESFVRHATDWLKARSHAVELAVHDEAGFHVIAGRGPDWCPRVYVSMITDLFQQGLTRCLVGTRGLLGEGWDATKVNVLIDMTTVTTSMSVNQLRGRSIRIDTDDPAKVADNWDIVCVAGEFSQGLDDYGRFIAKHRTLYGVTDDGAIEKGVGHVHAAFTELRPEGVEEALHVLNAEMLARAGERDRCRKLWKLGEPFDAEPVKAVEIKGGGGGGGFPTVRGAERELWSDQSLAMAVGAAVFDALIEAKLIARTAQLHRGERAGGYVRLFLDEAPTADGERFAASVHEAMGPLDRPRYVIQRFVDHHDATWLSKLMPQVIGRYLTKRRRSWAMLHAVPTELARNKDLAAVYQKHWNRHVSVGEVMYAHQGEGEKWVERAKREGKTPAGATVHEKDVFV